MKCPKCKKGKLYTLNATQVNGAEVRRTKKRTGCDVYFTTVERIKEK